MGSQETSGASTAAHVPACFIDLLCQKYGGESLPHDSCMKRLCGSSQTQLGTLMPSGAITPSKPPPAGRATACRRS